MLKEIIVMVNSIKYVILLKELIVVINLLKDVILC